MQKSTIIKFFISAVTVVSIKARAVDNSTNAVDATASRVATMTTNAIVAPNVAALLTITPSTDPVTSVSPIATTSSVGSVSTPASGGGSDGGGNTYHGKPLESYARLPQEQKSFQDYIAPILKNIESKKAHDNRLDILANLLTSVFTQKTWYFVPGPLEQIPADLLNSAVRTDQAALQGFDRVWIDLDIWNAMNAEDQARLFLHEAFMGLKILKFASDYRLCLAAYLNDSTCAGRSLIEVAISLNSKDYVDVQRATIQTTTQYLQMDSTAWVKMLNQNGIKFTYDWFDEYTSISPKDLGNLLMKSTMSGFLPTNGFNLRTLDSENHNFDNQKEMYEYLQQHKEVCNVAAKVKDQTLFLQYFSPTEKFEAPIPLEKEIKIRYDDIYHEGRVVQRMGFLYMTNHERQAGGYTVYNVGIAFDSFKLSHVFVQEMVCADPACKTSAYFDVKGGMTYICSENPELFKPLR